MTGDCRTDTVDGLMGAVAQGDERAFESLYERLAPAVLGLTRAVLGDSAQAERLTQEVFVEVWRTAALHQADEVGAVTWVMDLAHRWAVGWVRAVDTARCVPSNDSLGAGSEVLSGLERQSILLTVYAGHDYQAAAAMLGTTPDTVAHQLRSGLRRLSGLGDGTAGSLRGIAAPPADQVAGRASP